MPINFVTGLPRAGKTLWTMVHVRELAEKENRQVYTCNIPGVTVPGWQTIEHPNDWLQLPDGAIIIVDELQDFWGKAAQGARVPEPILELSKHGKRGFEFFFITQEPNLVHSTPRDLCAVHYYVVRAFGAQAAVTYKFNRIQVHPERMTKKAETIPWKYPKDAFTWYKSADVHNIKRKIPWKVKLIPVALLAVGVFAWGAVHMFQSTIGKAKDVPGVAAVAPTGGTGGGAVPGAPAAPATAAEVVASYIPRIEGLPHTAPRYDGMTTASTVPYPAACLSMGNRCNCYTQQATPLDVPASLCKQIVKGGMFLDWESALRDAAQGKQVTAAPGPVGPAAPPQATSTGSGGTFGMML